MCWHQYVNCAHCVNMNVVKMAAGFFMSNKSQYNENNYRSVLQPHLMIYFISLIFVLAAVFSASISWILFSYKDGVFETITHWYKMGTVLAHVVLWGAGVSGILIVTLRMRYALKEQDRMVGELIKSLEKYRSKFEMAPSLIMVIDAYGHVIECNKKVESVLGYTRHEMVGESIDKIIHPDDITHTFDMFGEIAKKDDVGCVEYRMIRKDGVVIDVRTDNAVESDNEGNIVQVSSVVEDITDRKAAEEKLRFAATSDPLTGLYNRETFARYISEAIKRAKEDSKYRFAVLFLDFDRFKVINDSLGHLVGDELLVNISRRMQSVLRSRHESKPNVDGSLIVDAESDGSAVSRLGGDEFGVLLGGLREYDNAELVAQRLQREISMPFNLNGNEVVTSASIGIVTSKDRHETPAEYLRDADTAMYCAKAKGRACHVVFDESMYENAIKRLKLESELRRAIEENELLLHYQPIMSIETGVLVGFEALVRWRRPDGKVVAPDDFIPIAEETGLMTLIGTWTLIEACDQLKQWQTEYTDCDSLLICVNMPKRQILEAELLELIREVISSCEIDPKSLVLEVSESSIMENIEAVIPILSKLREEGIGISMDDFGAGYSSLSHLHRFSLDMLKIDQSFIENMEKDAGYTTIVNSIILLANNMNICVVAKGIETVDQLVQLQTLDCNYAQGYYFAKPMPAEFASEFIKKRVGQSTDVGVGVTNK